MKRINIFLAILILAMLLAGCDKENSKDSSGTSTESSTRSAVSQDMGEKLSSVIENLEPKELKIEQIIKLLGDYGDFCYEYLYPQELEDFTDRKESFTFTLFDRNGEPYDKNYYKVTKKELDTPDKFFGKLKSLITENQLARVIDVVNNIYSAKDGYMYIGSTGVFGLGMGKDILYIDSVEYPDKETIQVNLTSFGDKDNWGTEEDIVSKFTVKLLRTQNGLRIDECEGDELDLYYFKEIIYNGETYHL